jgi:hypothetical protein
LKGKITGINYYQTFCRLRDIAKRNWEFEWFQPTIKMWNEIVFGDDPITEGSADGEDSDGYHELMDELEGFEAERDTQNVLEGK